MHKHISALPVGREILKIKDVFDSWSNQWRSLHKWWTHRSCVFHWSGTSLAARVDSHTRRQKESSSRLRGTPCDSRSAEGIPGRPQRRADIQWGSSSGSRPCREQDPFQIWISSQELLSKDANFNQLTEETFKSLPLMPLANCTIFDQWLFSY